MSDVCRYCGGPDEEDGLPTNSGTCGWCYYGMRLNPEEWEAEMLASGRPVKHVGGCVHVVIPELTDRHGVTHTNVPAIQCRNPFEPGGGE